MFVLQLRFENVFAEGDQAFHICQFEVEAKFQDL